MLLGCPRGGNNKEEEEEEKGAVWGHNFLWNCFPFLGLEKFPRGFLLKPQLQKEKEQDLQGALKGQLFPLRHLVDISSLRTAKPRVPVGVAQALLFVLKKILG